MEQQTLTISSDLYQRLQVGAQLRGVSVEQLVAQAVDEWERRDAELKRRAEAVDEANQIYERMRAKYGQMPDSAELIREDRER
jgi:hypothetical protein